MVNAVGRLYTVLDRAKVLLEFSCKDALFFLDAEDIRVLVGLCALQLLKIWWSLA